MAEVKPIPDEYPRITPYLYVSDGEAAIKFYSEVLGAAERMRMPGEGGTGVGHAELSIGDSMIMLADESPQMGMSGPKELGGTPVLLSVYVEDADAVYAKAVAAGATGMRPVENQFYGDRSGQFEDPFGHRWNVATHVEDVPPDEMAKRAAEAASQGQA
ncbi:MAG: VOC family protein [Actinomycetota bacterium]